MKKISFIRQIIVQICALVLLGINLDINLQAQSVYTCSGTNVYVRESNCNTVNSIGQVSNPQSYVVIGTTALNCGYTWYQIDIPSAHGISR